MDDWLCLENGMLNITTGDFKPHEKDYYATIALDVEYNPKSGKVCNRWLQFLDETIQTPEVIDFLQEFFGYCLTRSTAFGIALFLLGPGSDGKSVMLKILRALVGAANCSAVALADLEDQFHRASLYNKLVNISTETGAKAVESPYFKAIVTGDTISASYKHQQPFEFDPVCKQIFAGNQTPRVRDNSYGLLRRLKIIRFKQQFVGDKIDRNLVDTLVGELSEIFSWALAGLFRLLDQGHFTESRELDIEEMSFKRANNPILCFIEDCCATGDGYSCIKDDLFKEYKSFCSTNGYSPRNKENFFRELQMAQANLSQRRPREHGKRVYRLDGIQVVSEPMNV
jgi:putative DNA primase/helicase